PIESCIVERVLVLLAQNVGERGWNRNERRRFLNHAAEVVVDALRSQLLAIAFILGAVRERLRSDSQLGPGRVDRVDEARVQLRDFCGIDLYLGAVGLLQDQLILYEVANELHEQRVGRLLDLVEDAGLRRQSLQPADEPRGSELSGGRSREHGIVAAIGVRVVAKGARRRDRAFLDLDFPALLELREIGTLGDGDTLPLRVKQQLSLELVVRRTADDMV